MLFYNKYLDIIESIEKKIKMSIKIGKKVEYFVTI